MHNQCMTPTWYRPHSTLCHQFHVAQVNELQNQYNLAEQLGNVPANNVLSCFKQNYPDSDCMFGQLCLQHLNVNDFQSIFLQTCSPSCIHHTFRHSSPSHRCATRFVIALPWSSWDRSQHSSNAFFCQWCLYGVRSALKMVGTGSLQRLHKKDVMGQFVMHPLFEYAPLKHL